MRLLCGAREIARELGVSTRRAYSFIEHGGLPAFKSGRTIVVRQDVVADWVRRKETEAESKGRP